jgi:hypothetical protein
LFGNKKEIMIVAFNDMLMSFFSWRIDLCFCRHCILSHQQHLSRLHPASFDFRQTAKDKGGQVRRRTSRSGFSGISNNDSFILKTSFFLSRQNFLLARCLFGGQSFYKNKYQTKHRWHSTALPSILHVVLCFCRHG